jgi:hypothetical protein
MSVGLLPQYYHFELVILLGLIKDIIYFEKVLLEFVAKAIT